MDVARHLNSDHTLVEIDTNDFFKNIREGIKYCEVPLIFQGEAMFNYMFGKINESKNSDEPISCFDNNGADAILGHSRSLMAIRYIKLFSPFFRLFNSTIVRIKSKKDYLRNIEIIKGIKSNKFTPKFLCALFNETDKLKVVKEAFNLSDSDLSSIHGFELKELEKYDVDLIDKLYRLPIFEYETKRIANIDYQLAKNNNICLVFPFRDKTLINFLLNVPTKRKIKHFTDKYFGKKLLIKYLPKKLVYRKKIGKGIPFQKIFRNDKNFISIIEEIKDANYINYFNFDLNKIFYTKNYEEFAIKLINFHIWHKLFIDNIDGGAKL